MLQVLCVLGRSCLVHEYSLMNEPDAVLAQKRTNPSERKMEAKVIQILHYCPEKQPPE